MYEGELKKGKREGKGKIIFKNGKVDVGFFENDEKKVLA